MLHKYHFIGIGGIGMSGLARLALIKGFSVSGSDIATNQVTNVLAQDGAHISTGHFSENISSDMNVIYSTDIKNDNPELLAAKKLNCKLLHRSEFLQILMEDYQLLAVAGTHGKTTTSSLLAWVLESCGHHSSYAIGGIAPQLSSNSNFGSSNFFVAEVCESDGTFLNYSPHGAIITNIDRDHMDFYGTENALINAFDTFIQKVSSKNCLFWCADDFHLQKLYPQGFSYGFNPHCALKASRFVQKEWMLSFDAEFKGVAYENIEVSLVGKHNALNALAVFGLALSIGLDEKEIRHALKTFKGVLRRCEKKGELNGVLFLDDYAHHPTELKATLNSIRQAIGERRLVVAYQPHRYTRAADCRGMYGKVFCEADALFVTEIYAARESPIPGISHETIIAEVRGYINHRCSHIKRKESASTIAEFLRPHDVLLTLGAGDITNLSEEIMEKMALNPPSKIKVGLIGGGASVEHDISLISFANIFSALNQKYYEVEQFRITRHGTWSHGDSARVSARGHEEINMAEKMSAGTLKALLECDIICPILHGTHGEDGTIQGLFDMFSKAYVGCDHRSSAICMDKVLSKRLVLDAGILTAPFVSFNRFQWDKSNQHFMLRINQELTYPVFVKPIHLGSSIGIHKVASPEMLSDAIKDSFRFDTTLIVENGIEQMREIEFSVLGNNEITVFPPGEVHANGNLHDYDAKYGLNPEKAAAEFDAIAKLSKAQIEEGMNLAKQVYKTLGCSGLARVDTFLDADGIFWFNEINPIPGFTKYSLYPLMCQANGLPLDQLIDKLIVLGLERRRQQDRVEVSR